jgi:hypothetical protein
LERQENVRDALRKYVVYQTASLRNLQYDVDVQANVMDHIDPDKDIATFIEAQAGVEGSAPVFEPVVFE